MQFLPLYGEPITFDKPKRGETAVTSGPRPRITTTRPVGFLFGEAYVMCANDRTRRRLRAAGPEKSDGQPCGERDYGKTDGEQEKPGQQNQGDGNNHDRKHDENGALAPIQGPGLPLSPTMLPLHAHGQ